MPRADFMKLRYGLLLALLSFCIFLSTDWNKIWHTQYRELVNYSQSQQNLFVPKLLNAMPNSKIIYIKDLTDFEWDKVCAFGGYAHLQEDIANSHYLSGVNFPELQYYRNNNENEGALVFIEKNKVVAVVQDYSLNIVYSVDGCGTRRNSHFLPIQHNAKISDSEKDAYLKTPQKDRLGIFNRLPSCTNTVCDLVFIGGLNG